jgi:hypothetical protein
VANRHAQNQGESTSRSPQGVATCEGGSFMDNAQANLREHHRGAG